MESKEIRSSVIARSMRFNGLFRPLGQEKLIERQKQPKGFIQKSNSGGFTVIPTKELCRVYLQKPDLFASKGIIDAQAKPPHRQKNGSKSMGLKVYGEMAAKHRKFGRRFDHQNLKLKLRHHTSVDSLKSKIGKKENVVRSFSPLGFGSGSQLRGWKKGQYITIEKKSKELKKVCDGTTVCHKKDIVVLREVSSKLMVSTSRDSVLSLDRNRVAADEKFKHISSSGFISKDENEDSLDCSNASPGCQTNSEEAHQPSPVSVLEPVFYEDMLDDDEELPHLDFYGLEKQLDTLKSESDSYSDGSGMEVSSDEEYVLESETKENKDSEPIGFLNSQESRDSSYIDDILAEVVLEDKNWDKRESLDLLITPKIFEKLEKKYYTVTSWKRSERKVLFDRVNSGLAEIVESFTATPTWKKPVSRRLGVVLSTCRLKQELWKVLDRQEKRAKKESLDKVPVMDIDEWLEREADDESVVCELESMIVDDLLSEVVSFM
ncbi:hypothetical protein EUTSA_v10016572mg [Eutrema salsugineum]|uniref:DUF4378 domain-containing protein n=1 Tax=Eutrema salsugineum TaxID=72664 RepID=V4P061_EUTSA|nr:uncharacterized protein LOC18027366 [Eutrema salsugineum]XP_024004003.1 uncharacterized protein LOC18027366 [Eutrema salsugineum]ESQ52621.1 hypothetical protein EUTSA_v10016572mg [Eutrema salsugineum]